MAAHAKTYLIDGIHTVGNRIAPMAEIFRLQRMDDVKAIEDRSLG